MQIEEQLHASVQAAESSRQPLEVPPWVLPGMFFGCEPVALPALLPEDHQPDDLPGVSDRPSDVLSTAGLNRSDKLAGSLPAAVSQKAAVGKLLPGGKGGDEPLRELAEALHGGRVVLLTGSPARAAWTLQVAIRSTHIRPSFSICRECELALTSIEICRLSIFHSAICCLNAAIV